MEYPDLDLINRDNTWRNMICLNPDHPLVKIHTNEVGNIECPFCKALMVVEVIPNFKVIDDEN